MKEGFNLFGKKKEQPQQQQPEQQKVEFRSKFYAQAGGQKFPIAVEGISNGYSVWEGGKLLGDFRQYSDQYTNNFGTTEKNGQKILFYCVTGLKDHVGRPAYFTVATDVSNVSDEQTINDIKQQLKTLADNINKAGKQYAENNGQHQPSINSAQVMSMMETHIRKNKLIKEEIKKIKRLM